MLVKNYPMIIYVMRRRAKKETDLIFRVTHLVDAYVVDVFAIETKEPDSIIFLRHRVPNPIYRVPLFDHVIH